MAREKLTPAQAARILKQFDKRAPDVVRAGLLAGLNYARKLSGTRYMQGLGRGRNAKPANAPPGPIGIRSGDLRRSLKLVGPERVRGGWRGGLSANTAYAAIQERGGRTRPHVIMPRNAAVLAWQSGSKIRFRKSDGKAMKAGKIMTFAKRVNHPGSKIPARPYLRPALQEAVPVIQSLVDANIQNLANRLLG